MPRANRYHIPGCVWHITHRCHKRDFLLKFARDRRRWIRWLFEASKRYGLSILNYMVTSNHIHLVVVDGEDPWTIPRSMQLIEGRIAQEYNQRKRRKGAFWEDRYHAAAIQTGEHLAQCMVYIDLNMVRAGVVRHPSEWEYCGYKAIQNPPKRYQVIDRHRTAELLGLRSVDELAKRQRSRIEAILEGGGSVRESKWVKSIAVGDRAFVEKTMKKLGVKAMHRKITEENGMFVLKEPELPYKANFTPKNRLLSMQNSHIWNLGL